MRRLRRIGWGGLASVVILVIGGGCQWPAPGAGPYRQAYNSMEKDITRETVAGLQQQWIVQVSEVAVHDPITSEKAMHVAAGNQLFGLDKGTGATVWTTNGLAAPGATMGPAVAFGKDLWTGSGAGIGGAFESALLDPTTGAVVGQPSSDGIVDGVRLNQSVIRRPAQTGPGFAQVTFRFSQTAAPTAEWDGLAFVGSSLPSLPPLTLGDDFVYQAADVDGSPGVVAYSTKSPTPCDPPLVSYMCPTWKTELSAKAEAPPVLSSDSRVLYVVTQFPVGGNETFNVLALDADTGALIWEGFVPEPITAAPALANGHLYVPTTIGLASMNADTGWFEWGAPVGGSPIPVQPAVAGGVVYFANAKGTIYAFDAAGCGGLLCNQALWQTSVGNGAAITGAPAVSQGQLFVGTADGKVAAYGLAPRHQ